VQGPVLKGTPLREPQGAQLGSETVELAQRRLYASHVVDEHPGIGLGWGAVEHYAAGLAFAAQLKQEAVKPETRAVKCRDVLEFQTWLLKHTPRTLLDFRPADFEAYLAGWLTSHGRRGKLPSASTVKKLFSNLRGEVGMLHREGPWASIGTGKCSDVARVWSVGGSGFVGN